MKKHLFILLFVLTGVSLYAQETSLTLEVVPGKLASQLTKEQMATVKELTLTGEMYNCDFNAIKANTKVLEKLDLSKTIVDSIPNRALQYLNTLRRIEMPSILKFVGGLAFPPYLHSITWQNFPKEIKESAFEGCRKLQQYYVSENNPDYISVDGIIFSKDKKTLVAFPPGKCFEDQKYIVPEGVEKIDNYVFMKAYLTVIELPESVTSIGVKAFHVVTKLVKDQYNRSRLVEQALSQLICNNSRPPVLEGYPFLYARNTILAVPKESKELYRRAQGWSDFGTIEPLSLKLSFDVVPGKFASLLTDKQKRKVSDLILTGDLNKEDFCFIRDSLHNLRTIDIKQTKVDTIPAKAFFDMDIDTIILPFELKYIDEDAFSTQTVRNNMSVYITGKYPGRAANILRDGTWNNILSHLLVCKDNKFLKISEHGGIYSIDGKSLYDYFSGEIPSNNELEEGLEVIESYAFQDVWFCGYYIFPSTLKEIKKHAFYHFEGTYPVGVPRQSYNSIRDNSFVLKAKIPPILEEKAFVPIHGTTTSSYLIVPENCAEVYRNADSQWNDMFHGILEGEYPLLPPVANQPDLVLKRYIKIVDGTLYIDINEKQNMILHLFDVNGKNIVNYSIDDTNTVVTGLQKGIYFYRIERNKKLLDKGKFMIGE